MNDETSAIDWQSHIDRYMGGNLSKANYCAKYSIDVKQFLYHHRRYREGRKKPVIPMAATPNFAPLKVATQSSASRLIIKKTEKRTGIELLLRNGIRCKVEANFCEVTLKQVMELSL